MSVTATIRNGISALGYDINVRTNIVSDGGEVYTPELSLAKAAATYTKTGYTTGSGTLAASHGLTTGTYDIYWADGKRYGVTLTISTNDFTFTGGSGDNTPDSDTAVTICKQTAVNVAFEGDDLAAMCLSSTIVGASGSTGRCIIGLTDSIAGLTVFEIDTTLAETWHNLSAITNPLADKTIVSAVVSSDNTIAATDGTNEPLTAIFTYDSTP